MLSNHFPSQVTLETNKKDIKATVFFRTLAYVVSLAAVFWMSRNAPSKELGVALRDI